MDRQFLNGRDDHTNVSPDVLIESCSVSLNAVRPSELERALWLWNRRPRYILFDGGKILWGRLTFFCAIVFFAAAFDIPGLLVAGALSCVGATLVMFDFFWRERWKRDYDVCIARILRAHLL
jgi:hypothetical protein